MMRLHQILLFRWGAPGLCGTNGFELEARGEKQIKDEAPADFAFQVEAPGKQHIKGQALAGIAF